MSETRNYYDYIVYEDGRVYSKNRNHFLKGEITKDGYLQYTLSKGHGESFRIKAHRLVGLLFLETPENYKELVINHKDGNKLNNHYSNLEWVTQYENNLHARVNKLNDISKSNSERWKNKEWAEKTKENLSKAMLFIGNNKGENNPRFRYLIYDKNGKKYSRTELSKETGLSQSCIDAWIKRISDGKEITNPILLKMGIYVIDIKKESSSTIERAA